MGSINVSNLDLKVIAKIQYQAIFSCYVIDSNSFVYATDAGKVFIVKDNQDGLEIESSIR